MKNFAKLFFQRVVIVALCILLQLAVIYLLLTQFSGNARWFEIALKVLSWCAVIFILSDRSNPSFKIAWVIVIFALPVFGILLYLLFGGNRLSNRQREKMRAVDAYQRCNLQQDPNVYQRLAVAHPEGVAQTEYLLPVKRNRFYDLFDAALKKCGCRDLTPYACRHTAATKSALANDIAPSEVQQFMRHGRLETTQRYIHPDTSNALKAANTIRNPITGALQTNP